MSLTEFASKYKSVQNAEINGNLTEFKVTNGSFLEKDSASVPKVMKPFWNTFKFFPFYIIIMKFFR